MNAQKLASELKITKRTAQMVADSHIYETVAKRNVSVRMAIEGIRYARHTARISGTAEMNIRKLNGREYLGLVVEIINRNLLQSEVARFLEKQYGA